MNPTEYWRGVAAHDRYRTPSRPHGDPDHAISGMIAELAELTAAVAASDAKQTRNESGDVLWYATNWYQAIGDSDVPALRAWPRATQRETRQQPASHLARAVELAHELTRLHHYTAHRAAPLDRTQARKTYQGLARALSALSRTPVAELAAANIRKLNQRQRERRPGSKP